MAGVCIGYSGTNSRLYLCAIANLPCVMNILFVCSRNKWRSPTGEAVYNNVDGINARSAGTEAAARVRVNEKLINWADLICVMEQHHKKRLQQDFSALLQPKDVLVLDIPDEYQYMDEELVNMIRTSVDAYLADY